jgi:hypothetical protein
MVFGLKVVISHIRTILCGDRDISISQVYLEQLVKDGSLFEVRCADIGSEKPAFEQGYIDDKRPRDNDCGYHDSRGREQAGHRINRLDGVVCNYAVVVSSEELNYRRWEVIEVGTRNANRRLPQAITVAGLGVIADIHRHVREA